MLCFYLDLKLKSLLFSRSSVSCKLLLLPDPPCSLSQRHPQAIVVTAIVPNPRRWVSHSHPQVTVVTMTLTPSSCFGKFCWFPWTTFVAHPTLRSLPLSLNKLHWFPCRHSIGTKTVFAHLCTRNHQVSFGCANFVNFS